jgi:DNA-binding MarR family transcriptional regulator
VISGNADTELVSLIKRLATLLHQNIDLRLKPYDLARTQYIVLRKLDDGAMTASELAADMQVEPATLSGVIDTLETKGLVKRIERAEDKRRKDVCLTDAGHELLATIPSPGTEIEHVLREEVDPGDVHILRAVGQQMIKNLETELRKQEGGR